MFIRIFLSFYMSNPTGTIDLNQSDIIIRNFIFDTAKRVLDLRSVTQIETPAIELLSTVEHLYGDEFNKLVYNLNDEGQKLILRYDLTVPLARYVGTNGLVKFRRYQYGKVYRRDNPQIQKGRYREFYQFDYDIVGDDQSSMSNDLEMLETLSTLLDAIIEPSTYTIKINHKNIVIELLKIVGVPTELFQTVFSSLDKLDKKSFDDIKIELAQKGLDDNLIQTLETFYNEILQTHTTNLSQFELTIQKLQKLGICDETISKYFHLINTFLQKIKLNNFILDPFLIRGMDYYTGLIFEVAYNNKTIMESTISAGGRYDNMIGKFSTRGDIPAIGMSLGVERLVRILEQTKFKDVIFAPVPDIFVATVGKNMVVDRIVLCNKLRNLGYYTISSDLAEPDMRQQFAIVFEKYQKSIPVMIVIGENEVKSNTLTIKDVNKKKQFSIENDDRLIKQAIDNILNAPKS